MPNIGFDFGTTTSVLSYHDGHRIECFKHGGVSGTHYIPSVLSVEKEDSTIELGNAARMNMGDKDYEVYAHFKMLLAEQNNDKLLKLGYAQQLPKKIAQEYIGRLIAAYRKERNLTKALQNVVITVPEIWVREGRHSAREALKTICRALKLPRVRLLSEPVAASVYFAERYKTRYNKNFSGHVLVFDYGGGTLDLSLSAVEGDQIRVLEGTGKGNAQDTVGVAGVAFDEAVVKRVLGKEVPRDKKLFRLLKEFEERKINHTDKIAKSLGRYLKNPAAFNKKIFEIGEYEVKSQDLAEVFNELIIPELEKALTEMRTYLSEHQVNSDSGEQFRVVMVGGFSGFYLVRRAVRDFFKSKTDADSRFDTCFDLSDTALAISKGAALVANEQFKIDTACPISVGIRAINNAMKEVDIVSLQKGQSVTRYLEPRFCSGPLEVYSDEALDRTPLTIFLDVGGGKRRYINLEGKLKDFLPNPHKDNEWEIGFSVDQDLLFTLHVKDKSGTEKTVDLGALEEKIMGLFIREV